MVIKQGFLVICCSVLCDKWYLLRLSFTCCLRYTRMRPLWMINLLYGICGLNTLLISVCNMCMVLEYFINICIYQVAELNISCVWGCLVLLLCLAQTSPFTSTILFLMRSSWTIDGIQVNGTASAHQEWAVTKVQSINWFALQECGHLINPHALLLKCSVVLCVVLSTLVVCRPSYKIRFLRNVVM